MNEARLQRRIQKAIKARYPRVWLFKTHGSAYQPAGIPDILGCLNGRFFAFEVKLEGGIVSVIQQRTIERLRNAGACAHVVTSEGEALHFLALEVLSV